MKKNSRISLQPTAAPCALLLLAACAGEGDPIGGGNPNPSAAFAQVQAVTFDQRCDQPSCHAAQTRAGGLSLASGQSYAELVGVTPQNATAAAAGATRVEPSSEAESFLLRKLTGELAPGEGSPMPLGSAGLRALAPSEYEAIRSWVLAGAPRDPEP